MTISPPSFSWLLALGMLLSAEHASHASGLFKRAPRVEGRFAGQVLDFTHNHGVDRRIWSDALQEKRDLYVYLPPGFDPGKRYPLLLWFHGILQDEQGLIEQGLPEIDQAIACGKFPPTILVIPDGSLPGRPGFRTPHSGFLNTRAGRFEDFLFEVYGFVCENFPVRPEREAQVLAGVSIGGGAAFLQGIKHRHQFGVVVGVYPPLNIRWQNCHGRYFGNFDPDCWGWMEHYCLGLRPIGKFYGGLISVPARRLIHPLYGHGNQVVGQMSRDNPIELLDRYDLKDGELQMLVAYGGKDQFNLDAQIESFLFRARQRCLKVDVVYNPRGRHDATTALGMLPEVLGWLAQRLEPFHPDVPMK